MKINAHGMQSNRGTDPVAFFSKTVSGSRQRAVSQGTRLTVGCVRRL